MASTGPNGHLLGGTLNASLIIPNWNGEEYLKECLESITRQHVLPHEVIVVDNGSTDSSCEIVHQLLPQATLVRLERNYGFSYAVNRGIERARSEWIVLINNDVVLKPHFLGQLLTAIRNHPEYHFLAAKLLCSDQTELVDGAGDAMLLAGASFRLGHREPDGEKYAREREVFAACAAAAAYRSSLIEQLGGFDEDFFAYLEDADLALRARWAGYRCLYVPSAVGYHQGSASLGGELNPTVIQLITQNQILLLAKNFPGRLLLRAWLRILWVQLLWLGFTARRGCVRFWARGVVGALTKLPATWRKRSQSPRCLTNAEMWNQLTSSERQIWESFMAREKNAPLLLRSYFAVFPPRRKEQA